MVKQSSHTHNEWRDNDSTLDLVFGRESITSYANTLASMG